MYSQWHRRWRTSAAGAACNLSTFSLRAWRINVNRKQKRRRGGMRVFCSSPLPPPPFQHTAAQRLRCTGGAYQAV